MASALNAAVQRCVPRLKQKNLFNYSQVTQTFFIDIPNDLYVSIFVYGKLLNTLGIVNEPNPSQEDYIICGNKKDKLSYKYGKETRYFYNDENEWKSDAENLFYFQSLSLILNLMKLAMCDGYIIIRSDS